jgi:ATP-dependent RNA helicase DDX24/MAK5
MGLTLPWSLQVCQHLQVLGKQVGVRVIGLVGGIAPVKQDRLLRQKPPVVVATPGRLWDLMRQGQQHLCDLSRLSFFVLDEADRMVQQVRRANNSSNRFSNNRPVA